MSARNSLQRPATIDLYARRFETFSTHPTPRSSAHNFFSWTKPYVSLLKKERGRRKNNDHALKQPREHRTRVRGSPRWLVQLSREMNTHGPFNSDHSTLREEPLMNRVRSLDTLWRISNTCAMSICRLPIRS